MLANNSESASDKCFIGPKFVESVIDHEGWVRWGGACMRRVVRNIKGKMWVGRSNA